jgi:hypothetical protein
MKRVYLCLFLPLISLLQAKGQVVINEYSCSNFSQTADNFGAYEDWIELYNPGVSAVNIGNYHLSDKITQPTKWQFPPNVMIAANSRLIVYASGRNTYGGGYYHTNFKITQTKLPSEYIVFSDASGNIIDQVTVTPTQKHQSRGRNPDGGSGWSIYTTPTPNAANNNMYAKQGYAATPSFSMLAGFYNSTLSVSISSTEPGATIYYTTDGTVPTTSSSQYSGPITIDSTTVLKAIALSPQTSLAPSMMNYSTYFINEVHTLPVVSIAGNQLQQLADGNQSLKPEGTIEYFNMSKHRTTSGYGTFNSHGQDSWANDQRSLDFIMRDEFGYNYALQEQLFHMLTPRDEFQRVILRAAGDDNYPASHHASNAGSAHLRDAYLQNLAKTGGLDLDVRTATKCIIYLNGIYWGVYDLRELPDDHDYTKYYYNQDKFNLQYIETWGNTWAEYGGNQALTDWSALRTWVMAGNMTDPATWDSVVSQIDVNSLADYVIANSISVCSDWLNYNTGWWRGLDPAGQHKRWGWILWDNDAIFGFYINYTGIPDKGPLAAPCNVESPTLNDPEGHIDLLNKLRQNPDFNQYYISRYIDLTNTVFSCSNMLNTLDSLTAVIDPEMARHAARWFGTYQEWQQNVQQLRDFIDQRCNAFPSLMNTCYNLTGPYPLLVDATPIGIGQVKVNSLTISNFPFTGNYHGGIAVKLQAIADTTNGFYFDHWQTLHNSVSPSTTSPLAELQMTTGDTLIAHFAQQPVTIIETGSGFEANAYPSVFSRETRLDFEQKDNTSAIITVYTASGIPVYRLSGATKQGWNSIPLNFADRGLSTGIYMLNIKTQSGTKTFRLVYTGDK